MRAYDLIELAGRNLREAGLRNSLTTLGIGVGVASLVAMLSLGIGLQKLATRQLGRSGLFDTVVVTSRQDSTTGEAIVAYVTLKSSAEPSVEKLQELRDHVAKKIGAIAKPANIVFTPELPKTRSGKIMRRLLRDVAENRPLGDTTTLADPAVVDEIKTRAVAESPDE